MKNFTAKEETSRGFNSWLRIVTLLLCIWGVAISVPNYAQKKPRNVQMRSVSSSIPSGYTQVGNTMLYYRQTSSSIDVNGLTLKSMVYSLLKFSSNAISPEASRLVKKSSVISS